MAFLRQAGENRIDVAANGWDLVYSQVWKRVANLVWERGTGAVEESTGDSTVLKGTAQSLPSLLCNAVFRNQGEKLKWGEITAKEAGTWLCSRCGKSQFTDGGSMAGRKGALVPEQGVVAGSRARQRRNLKYMGRERGLTHGAVCWSICAKKGSSWSFSGEKKSFHSQHTVLSKRRQNSLHIW